MLPYFLRVAFPQHFLGLQPFYHEAVLAISVLALPQAP